MENSQQESETQDKLKKLIKQASTQGVKTEQDLHRLKKRYAKEHELSLPTNWSLQKAYKELLEEGWKGDEKLQKLMRKRKIRTLSGVSIVTVLTKPYACPGKCVFCPTEPGMPKSYLSNEPGAMRAVLEEFDPAAQVKTRLSSLSKQGHETDKVEMIVLGGTFSFYDRQYQEDFIKKLFTACNNSENQSLEQTQITNETATHRIIGLSLETRSDQITEEEVAHMCKLGATKVQIGIQHTDNKILALNKRGETTTNHAHALQLLKDAGFKIAAHLMPNLAGSTPEKDIQMIHDFFQNPAYKTDQIKLYPCVVTPYSELEKWWQEGKYKSYSDETLMHVLLEIKKAVPEYVRIERLYRDIPGESILAGSQKTNMRQLLHDQMKKDNIKCHCIRCREIKDGEYSPESTKLRVLEYDSSGGKEFFISFNDEEKDKLCSLLRLRFPSQHFTGKPHFIPELEGAALIREVHVYGQQVKIGNSNLKNFDPKSSEYTRSSQHTGLGQKMLEAGEEIAKKAGFKKIAVISGVGVRNYYRKFGYELEGTYMTKSL
jgi:elongator complex protein 3